MTHNFTAFDHREARRLGVSLGAPATGLMELHNIEIGRQREMYEAENARLRELLCEANLTISEVRRSRGRWETAYFVAVFVGACAVLWAISR